ncbi:MAG: hypothetical protein GWN01_17270 [Nitrosopumilaceae archaeon]|nr:hypothetical protein [Nitrosopumilaceae archaeon]NIU02578.1 hypothetical protein [Nitrosopumilaceae archaeon]NIU89044.1 hypothetical protein [Nitrosopumilaceae archaeon]NIV67148.1 hypothetical protein [Nitrosopumilaceae archaeon]NIX63179.1 hypothetical protein [Nitrosopumilaceae archaeon]
MEDIHPIKKLAFEYLKNADDNELSQCMAKNTQNLISKTVEHCIQKISNINKNKNESLAVLATSILHFLLTNLLIPSQRKVNYRRLDLDIVIPDLKTLQTNPQNCLIIVIAETTNPDKINTQINRIIEIQPHVDRIWLVLGKDVDVGFRKYVVGKNFHLIIHDMVKTIDLKKHAKLNVFRT